MRWHGPQRVEGEVRVLVRQAIDRLTKSEVTLQSRISDRDRVTRDRDEYFGRAASQARGATAAEGLSFGSLDELRNLRFKPPPIVELVSLAPSPIYFSWI
jgi:hypothetical protein